MRCAERWQWVRSEPETRYRRPQAAFVLPSSPIVELHHEVVYATVWYAFLYTILGLKLRLHHPIEKWNGGQLSCYRRGIESANGSRTIYSVTDAASKSSWTSGQALNAVSVAQPKYHRYAVSSY